MGLCRTNSNAKFSMEISNSKIFNGVNIQKTEKLLAGTRKSLK